MRRSFFVLPLLLAVVFAAAPSSQQSPAARSTNVVSVQLLAINDFHGNLDPPTGANGRIGSTDAGGIEFLATHLARLKATNPNTLIVSAGDSIGASPLLSGLFHDEPTIEALNAVGLDVSSVGNHEFDEGWRELFRMQQGGCHATDGCQDHTPFAGAKFEFLSANVFLDPRMVDKTTLARIKWPADRTQPGPLMPAYAIKQVGGVKIGFIGMTLQGTGRIVIPTGVRELTFQPEARTANDLVPALLRQGVRAIVVLIHEGGVPKADDYNGCNGVSGRIIDIANQMSNAIDVIVSGHTHRAYNCMIGTKLVTSAASFGRVITDIDLTIDKTTDKVVSKTATNVIVSRDVAKTPALSAILDHYRPFYTTLAHKVIGTMTADITRRATAAGESALGDVIADAHLEGSHEAVVAFTNTGGLRADLTARRPAGSDAPAAITYEDAFTVQPFQNRLIVKTLTGAMITRLLDQQCHAGGEASILQVSNGFAYSYDPTRPAGQCVDPTSIKIDGRVIEPALSYRVAMNEFLSTGGDGFTVFTEGTNAVDVGVDIDALVAYFDKHSPVAPGPQNRIVKIGAPPR